MPFSAFYNFTSSVLFYWQREVVQIIKCRGANNCGTHGFGEKKKKILIERFHFLRIHLLYLKIFLNVSVRVN